MTSINERSRDAAKLDDSPLTSDSSHLDLGQRRAVAWPRLEPSVAHRAGTAVLVAVVHTVDSIRFIAAAREEEALLRQVASYVAANANDRLWMADAVSVHALLAARDFEAAVRAYFTTTDTPWDRDWLVIESIH
jgi:hypothetical protein